MLKCRLMSRNVEKCRVLKISDSLSSGGVWRCLGVIVLELFGAGWRCSGLGGGVLG